MMGSLSGSLVREENNLVESVKAVVNRQIRETDYLEKVVSPVDRLYVKETRILSSGVLKSLFHNYSGAHSLVNAKDLSIESPSIVVSHTIAVCCYHISLLLSQNYIVLEGDGLDAVESTSIAFYWSILPDEVFKLHVVKLGCVKPYAFSDVVKWWKKGVVNGILDKDIHD